MQNINLDVASSSNKKKQGFIYDATKAIDGAAIAEKYRQTK